MAANEPLRQAVAFEKIIISPTNPVANAFSLCHKLPQIASNGHKSRYLVLQNAACPTLSQKVWDRLTVGNKDVEPRRPTVPLSHCFFSRCGRVLSGLSNLSDRVQTVRTCPKSNLSALLSDLLSPFSNILILTPNSAFRNPSNIAASR